MNPFGNNYHSGYMTKLYELLMYSIGKTPSFANYRANRGILHQLVNDHYFTTPCIRDFSAYFNTQRADFFKPIFDTSFNKEDL